MSGSATASSSRSLSSRSVSSGRLREILARRRPPALTPAVTRLRVLIAVTAVVVVVVEALNLLVATDAGPGLGVRSAWALLRVVGFLALLRAVRLGRAVARPFGLVLAITTVFAVARLATPRDGSLVPRAEVLVGLTVLTVLCGVVVGLLYRSPAVAAHLAHRPARRPVPPAVLTARVAALSLAPLVLVPLLVGVGLLFADDRPHPLARMVVLLAAWGALFLAVSVVAPVGSFFALRGKGWARWLTGAVTVVVLVAQPLLCWVVLGLDGLLRDGLPLVLTAVVGLFALHRSRPAARPSPVAPAP
jgi:hypothetical protein